MYKLMEMIVGTLFAAFSLMLTLLAIKLADLFGNNWLLVLIPVFIGLLTYLFLYVGDYSHNIIISIYLYKFRKDRNRDTAP